MYTVTFTLVVEVGNIENREDAKMFAVDFVAQKGALSMSDFNEIAVEKS